MTSPSGAASTYTVREPGGGDVIGCVYIYPLKAAPDVATVSSWDRADRADLDVPLHRAVTEWLERDWSFPHFEYAPRSGSPGPDDGATGSWP